MKNLATAIATSGHLIEQNKQGLSVEDVFSTYVYTGTGAALDIVNGIDCVDNDALTWISDRTATAGNFLTDTIRGAGKALKSETTAAEGNNINHLSSFNSDGFSVGVGGGAVNTLNVDYASWTFRKAPRFFDVVTWTGNGVAGREIAHDLGVAPGMIIVKETSLANNWVVYHRSLGATNKMYLNYTDASGAGSFWNNTAPTDSVFSVSAQDAVNLLDETYVAYIFAHDPDGPSGDGSDGLIACGSYIGDGGAGTTEIDLGWEPQYILVKNTTGTAYNWIILDNMRGIATGNAENDARLRADTADSEVNGGFLDITATGFKTIAYNNINQSGQTYIYMAIRRGMRTPESSDEVFAIDTFTGIDAPISTNYPVDVSLYRETNVAMSTWAMSRLAGVSSLSTDSTAAETTTGVLAEFDSNDSFLASSDGNSRDRWYATFKRATGFFDVVAYTGDGIAGRTVDHNLGVVPEMMWVKLRSGGWSWTVYHSGNTNEPQTEFLTLNAADATIDQTDKWNDTLPTSTVFTVGNGQSVNGSGYTVIAYLFATLAGISKVGSYTGNGTNQTLDCGFSAGAKFVLIKRTDSTGDWFMWDSLRGIVAGNDPHLSLNTTAAEVTSDDSIDPDSTGFIVNQVAATNINVNAGEYIYYAIA